MSEKNDFIQLPPIKKDTPSEVVSIIWQYLKLPEESRKRVTADLIDVDENCEKEDFQIPDLYDIVPKEEIAEFEETMRKIIAGIISQARACLKNHSRNLHAPLCGIFHPNSVAVAHYGALIRAKYPTNCDAHLAESLFQTHSSIRSIIFSTHLPPALSYHPVHDNRCIPAPVPVFPCRNLSVIPREHP